MKRLLTLVCFVFVGPLIVSADLAAQDLVVTNARIVDGNGGENAIKQLNLTVPQGHR